MMLIPLLETVPFISNAQQKHIACGYVMDSLGTPIKGATILLQPDNISLSTDKNGYFKSHHIFLGTYQYDISALGFQTSAGSMEIRSDEPPMKFTLLKQTKEIEEISILGKTNQRPTLMDPLNSSMPVKVITRKQIELLGSRRLDEVLGEQTGMAIVNNTSGGNRSVGVQMQGLSSQYIMVLMDGQPILGRQSGSLDLSRISVSNIERIEIIKGASSCLYGNDALGGAINIITRYGTTNPQIHLQTAYGSYNTWDMTGEVESNFNKDKGYFLLSGNYYNTDGFNNNKRYLESGTTVPPYDNLAVQGKIRHTVGSDKQYLSLNFRSNKRVSQMTRKYTQDDQLRDYQSENEWNTSLSFDKRWDAKWKSLSNYYFSSYHSDIRVTSNRQEQELSRDKFQQYIHKLEHQLGYSSQALNMTFGLQAQVESMNITSSLDRRDQYSFSFYGQGNYKLGQRTLLTGGLRFDHTAGYGSQLSPSFGGDYQLIKGKLFWKTGIAFGYKAPDFKTRYQTFYNPSANYYVIGNQVLESTLEQMENDGAISEIRQYAVNQARNPLKAEKNISVNSGLSFRPSSAASIDVNFFYHRLKNQINSIQVATGTRNMAIYSFQNLPESENKGIEVNFQSMLLSDLTVSGGYQYLLAKDLGVMDSINNNVWPYNQMIHDPKTGNSYSPKESDYWGLENRSRHQFNLALIYQFRPWNMTVNLRGNFRGRYPFMDQNGNQFIDKYDVFVENNILYHAGIEKKFETLPLSIRINMDNITNYTNYLIPGQLGRATTLSVSYRFIKKTK
ncbi:MAG: TonB-dependent receptor [Sphingobacterium sp.]